MRTMRCAAVLTLLLACSPPDPRQQWCHAADNWIRATLARDGIVGVDFVSPPPCIVKETGTEAFRIVGHGYATDATKRDPAMPYAWVSSVVQQDPPGSFAICGARFFYPGGTDELVRAIAPGCHVDLDAALGKR